MSIIDTLANGCSWPSTVRVQDWQKNVADFEAFFLGRKRVGNKTEATSLLGRPIFCLRPTKLLLVSIFFFLAEPGSVKRKRKAKFGRQKKIYFVFSGLQSCQSYQFGRINFRKLKTSDFLSLLFLICKD
jgi:hypothetical protein